MIETSAGYQINVDRIVSISNFEGGSRIVEIKGLERHTYICREPVPQIIRAIQECTSHRKD